MADIRKLRDEYLLYADPEDNWIRHCKKLRTLGEQVFEAARSRDCKGRKHPHQFRLVNSVLESFGAELQANLGAIRKARTFDELHETIRNIKVSGVGPVARYDTALRIGHCMNILPDRVYLHAGTRTGARFHGIGHENDRFIHMHELPDALKKMTAQQVEDFLCIYKDGKSRQNGGCGPDGRIVDVPIKRVNQREC